MKCYGEKNTYIHTHSLVIVRQVYRNLGDDIQRDISRIKKEKAYSYQSDKSLFPCNTKNEVLYIPRIINIKALHNDNKN